jgi:hypothetical protein
MAFLLKVSSHDLALFYRAFLLFGTFIGRRQNLAPLLRRILKIKLMEFRLKLAVSCKPDTGESVQLESQSPAVVALALREAVAERNCDLVCPFRNAGGTTRSGKTLVRGCCTQLDRDHFMMPSSVSIKA